MTAGVRYVLWQRRLGVLAMILLAGALLSLADALVGGLGGSRGTIELIPDSRYQISGPMPPRTEAIKDFVIEGQPKSGEVRLVPEAVFTGYWFGGSMWRGLIVVAATAREGSFVIAVKDRFGEKQNPALQFTVKIWPDEATRNTHSPSFLTRRTGRSPYLFAVGLAIGGLGAGMGNFLCGRLWARHLARHQCGEIYKLRHTERGTEITCEVHCAPGVHPGMHCTIHRTSGEQLCAATVTGCDNNEVLMLVADGQRVRLGDVACLRPELIPAGSAVAKS